MPEIPDPRLPQLQQLYEKHQGQHRECNMVRAQKECACRRTAVDAEHASLLGRMTPHIHREAGGVML